MFFALDLASIAALDIILGYGVICGSVATLTTNNLLEPLVISIYLKPRKTRPLFVISGHVIAALP